MLQEAPFVLRAEGGVGECNFGVVLDPRKDRVDGRGRWIFQGSGWVVIENIFSQVLRDGPIGEPESERVGGGIEGLADDGGLDKSFGGWMLDVDLVVGIKGRWAMKNVVEVGPRGEDERAIIPLVELGTSRKGEVELDGVSLCEGTFRRWMVEEEAIGGGTTAHTYTLEGIGVVF